MARVDLRDRRALVLDGELRSALAVTRSLGAAGAAVIVAAPSADCLAGASKYAIETAIYADPQTSELQFVADVAALCAQHAITDLLPLSEVALGTILRHRDRFLAVALPYVERDTYELSVDKYALAQLAQTLGIRSPQTVLCAAAAEVGQWLPQLRYPVVLKPVRSRVYLDGGWLPTRVQYADSEQALLQLLDEHAQYQHPFMLQEFVSGSGEGVFLLYDQGREIARFSHRRIREKPPSGGVSVLAESRYADEKLFEQASRLLSALKWHGVAMVEFKVTAAGEPYLMEINPRFWGSLQLAIDAGVDFPALLLAMKTTRIEPVTTFEQGVRLRWLLGDLDHLFIVLKSRAPLAKKISALFAFCNFFSTRTRYETLQRGDTGPFRRELKLYVDAMLGAIRKRGA